MNGNLFERNRKTCPAPLLQDRTRNYGFRAKTNLFTSHLFLVIGHRRNFMIPDTDSKQHSSFVKIHVYLCVKLFV